MTNMIKLLFMKSNITKQFFLLTVFILLPLCGFSQVTIGSGNPPHADALLDLKEDSNGNSQKGLLMPRVTLISKTLSYPLSSHVRGMVVYNTRNLDADIYEGCYYNNGSGWIRIGSSGSIYSVTASNGLTATGNNVILGGALTGATTISGISATNKLSFTGTGINSINFFANALSLDGSNNRVGIGTVAPVTTLHVNGTARITGSTGTAASIVGRNASGDIQNVTLGSGLSLSGGVLTATPGTSTTIYAYLLNYTISAYNVTTQTTPVRPAHNDYTVWMSGNPNVGTGNPHVVLPTNDSNVGRVINIIASEANLRVAADKISGGIGGFITISNGANVTSYEIPFTKRASFQYIGNAWSTEGTWIVMMKDF